MLKVNRIKILFLVLMLTLTLNLKHSLAGGFCPVSLVTALVDYGDNGVLAWDPENATQISRITCADINVEGRQWPEYKWTVTGDGFSLAQLTTTLPTN